MQDCIFCKIVRGELPCYKVYEDESFLGFLDIYPRAVGHTLIIPKKHYRWVHDVEDGNYWEAVVKVTKAIDKALRPEFINYFTFGLDVHHAHFHIIPRYGDVSSEGIVPGVKKISKEEMSEIAKKIYKEGLNINI
ncbi:hypothetical protein A3C25_04320 [Candidatus Roizmanbacteria bacterium RIFCSPHIGHO2_02_FULL_38_11]|uniref:HIT domain-containing protein n=1 Tax=Candidatus Roizmanbacteria bacterium RIFCSPHIGHO2_02_FULL_38_11 TaxID=1802039 RepID=A0A1F7H4E3_9BACT|nr:MAG: hypothetical protein A3C25_04320 [Candidatus Roizmanbacteria bacterium RIFCSPHIGHO2_02_FULL_38_11]